MAIIGYNRYVVKILYAGVAQSVVQLIRNQQVVCSSHITSSKEHLHFVSAFCFNAFRQLSAPRETDNHPLCGWATKVIPKNLLMWYNKMLKSIATRKEKEWQTEQIVYPILNGFVSTT